MSLTVLLTSALRLPVQDWVALTQGQMIVATPKKSIFPGLSFALFPDSSLTPGLPAEERCLLNRTPAVQDVVSQSESDNSLLRFWARCEFCKVLDQSSPLDSLSRLTIWTKESLEAKLAQQPYLFLAYLRVYEMNQLPRVVREAQDEFMPLLEPLMVADSPPILSDYIFEKRKQQLENLEPPEHPELEELYSAVTRLGNNDPQAKGFEQVIRQFLGWTENLTPNPLKPDLAWTREIVELGHRSKEQDDGRKNNYQAGTDFENIVRKGLEFLGFTVDESYKGGAGGLDLFCSKPYPLVGECKAGKRIPSGTTQELVRLGGMHLSPDNFVKSAKLIIGPGSPTPDVITAATQWRISIIGPMSLQKLVELQAKYPGSVDLWELKKYLEPGQIDARIDEFIDQVLSNLRLRAEIIQLVKKFLETSKQNNADAAQLHAIYSYSNPSTRLEPEEMREILIELSSPLTGYLGRKKEGSSDRFYFLRDLLVWH